MTPPPATTLLEEQAASELVLLGTRLSLVADPSTALPAERHLQRRSDKRVSSLLWRETFHRRMLALGDVAAASVALVVLLNVFDQRRVAALAVVGAIPWLCTLLIRGLFHHWRNASPGGSAFNPMLEFVQPRARHVIEVQEQRLKQDDDGAPPEPGSRAGSEI